MALSLHCVGLPDEESLLYWRVGALNTEPGIYVLANSSRRFVDANKILKHCAVPSLLNKILRFGKFRSVTNFQTQINRFLVLRSYLEISSYIVKGDKKLPKPKNVIPVTNSVP